MKIEPPLSYLVTDGRSADTTFADDLIRLTDIARAAVEANVSLLQIREKELSAKYLFILADAIGSFAKTSKTKVLINERADIAAAARIDGVHLSSTSIPLNEIRRHFPKLFLAKSTHTIREVRKADADGADLIIFGPVFETPGKSSVGLNEFRKACESVSAPIIGIGGIDASNALSVIAAGGAGIAGIRCFQDTDAIRSTAKEIGGI